ncbi:hypothetical protein EJB05_41389 [Eragrostis curvula]|uniref:Uncharacterized protein n=1 Tax=Eragrostis curvula TaxID=38414 RepID=A0A5J9T9T7_9POAL|nr:hypothetical protein EJB05_58127 [Eragrostis curvula]TVU08007.1 hypothetical protein EJB05_41389 [Eragrostis curvula]
MIRTHAPSSEEVNKAVILPLSLPRAMALAGTFSSHAAEAPAAPGGDPPADPPTKLPTAPGTNPPAAPTEDPPADPVVKPPVTEPTAPVPKFDLGEKGIPGESPFGTRHPGRDP